MIDNIDPLTEIISSAKCMSGFRPEDLKNIMSISNKQTWRKGVDIFIEGDRGRDMFIICSGKVSIWREDDKKRVGLATISAGDSLGEMGLVSDAKRRAGAQAVEDTVALRISYEGLKQVPATAFLLFRNIAWTLAERLTVANELIFQSKLDPVAPPLSAPDKNATHE